MYSFILLPSERKLNQSIKNKKMKKLILATALLVSLSSFASNDNKSDVNTLAKKNLLRHYSGATNIEWKSEAQFNKASFQIENQKLEVFYDQNGDLIGTTKVVAFDKLPKAAIQTITSEYTFPEFNLRECIEFVDAYNVKKYFISMETVNDRIILEISKTGSVSTYIAQ